jgi:flagellar hook protein FlgE
MGYNEENLADINSDTELSKIKLSWEDDNDGVDKRYMNISIDKNGQITGKRIEVDDNDPDNIIVTETIDTIGYLSLATFNNTSGLEKAGESLYRVSNNSGAATCSLPNTQGAGKLMGGGLEMSNVDLANEFTDMIITQRGFQANSRSITVSDTMLEELINLKR